MLLQIEKLHFLPWWTKRKCSFELGLNDVDRTPNPYHNDSQYRLEDQQGGTAAAEGRLRVGERVSLVQSGKPRMTYMGHKRKPGTGHASEINDHLFEGQYSPMQPDSKKHSRNVYAHTREECEEKLKVLIEEMKAEIQAIKRSGAQETIPDGVSKKKYIWEHPEITNRNLIAREVEVDKSTVKKYYDEIRKTSKKAH